MKLKKMFSIFLALIMVLALGTNAFAANITIGGDNKANGSEYSAYRLLDATDGGDGKFAYTLNGKYADVLKEVTGEESQAEILAYINAMTSNSAEIKKFADDVYAAIKAKELETDSITTTDKFEDVAQGYYLIAETKLGTMEDGSPDITDTYSLIMLDTAGEDDITVNTKEGKPTLEKKVQEKNDSESIVEGENPTGWQDGADYDIGDDVPYKLTGTVSDRYADYKTYYYAFHDKLSPGLTFNEDSVVVKVDGKTVNAEDYEVVTENLGDGCTFEVIFNNLKTVVAADDTKVTATSKITVEFTAKLNSGAVIGGDGNPNEAKLEYSNNPYDESEGKPETGETPEDKVIVFTYKMIANKVDGDKNPLEGAGFTLYKFYADKVGEIIDEENNIVSNGWVAVGDEITGETTFTFTGLDAGDYKLVETTVPAGYNKADDIYFTIEATYETEDDDPVLLTLVIKDTDGNIISGDGEMFTVNMDKGSASTDVVNQSGTELPSTGGMGTTIFYMVGGLMMAGAVVLLITKKKMAGSEN